MRASLLLVGLIALDAQAQGPGPALPDPLRQSDNTLQDERYFEEQRRAQSSPGEEVVIAAGGTEPGLLPETDDVFELDAIRFSASEFIPQAELEALSASYLRRPVGFADLNELVGKVNAIYAERGIVSARAIVPPQTVEEGTLEVRLVEGRLGELLIQGNRSVKPEFISRRLSVVAGEVVNVPQLRDELTHLSRTSELTLQTAMRAGQMPGTTDLLLAVQEPARWDTQLFVDNLGTDTTGENRFGAFARLYAPLGRDDRLTLYAVGGEGAANFHVAYGVPVTRGGGRLEGSFTYGDISIVDGPFVDLDITGESTSLVLKYNHPVLRGNRYWLDVHGTATQADSETVLDTSALSEYSISRYDLGATLQGFGERMVWSLSSSYGSADAEDIFGVSTPVKLFSGNASLMYRIGDRWNARVNSGWQITDEDTAPSPLMYQVGGVSTVRGYVNGVVAGAKGYHVNLESSYRFNGNLLPFVFYDFGHIDDISPDKVDISSAGIGLSWQYGQRFSGELSWAQALEDILPDQDAGRVQLRVAYSWSR